MNSKVLEYAPNFLNNTSSISGDVSTKSFQTVKIGQNAGSLASGESNVFIGTNSAFNSLNNSHCVFIGAYTGISTKNGSFNTFLGSVSGINVVDGSFNTVCGYNAGNKISSGSFNTIFGANTGNGINEGNYNVVYGVGNVSDITNSYSNIVIGNHNVSSRVLAAYKNITIGNSNIFDDQTENSVVLGNNCLATTKSVVIGNDLKGDTQNNIAIGSNISLINRGIITDPLISFDEIIRNNAINRINLDIIATPQQRNLIHTPYNILYPPQKLSTTNSVSSTINEYTIEERIIDPQKLSVSLHTIVNTLPINILNLYDIYIPNFINGPKEYANSIDLSLLYIDGFQIPYKYSVVDHPEYGYILSNVYGTEEIISIVEYPEYFLEETDKLTLSLEIYGTTRNNPKHTISIKRNGYSHLKPLEEIFVSEDNIKIIQGHFNMMYYNIHSLQNLQFIRSSTNNVIPVTALSLNSSDLHLYRLRFVYGSSGKVGTFNMNGNVVKVYKYSPNNDPNIQDEYTITFIGIDKNEYFTRNDLNLPENTIIYVEEPSKDGYFNLGNLFSVGDISRLVFSGLSHSKATIRIVDKDNQLISRKITLLIKTYIYRDLTMPLPSTFTDDNYELVEDMVNDNNSLITIKHRNAPNIYPNLITHYIYNKLPPLRKQIEILSPKTIDITIYPFNSIDLSDYIETNNNEYRISLIEGGECGYVDGSFYSNIRNVNDTLKLAITNDQYDYIEENTIEFHITIQNTFRVVVNDQYVYSGMDGATEKISITSPDPIYLNTVEIKDVYVGLSNVGDTEYQLSVGQPYHQSGFRVNHKVLKDRFVFIRDIVDQSEINEIVYRLNDGVVSSDFILTHDLVIRSLFNNIPIPEDKFEYKIFLDDQEIIINNTIHNFVYGRLYRVQITSSGLVILDMGGKGGVGGVIVYRIDRETTFQQATIHYDLNKNLINISPDLVNYTLTLEISSLTLDTSIDDTASHNLGIGKNIRTSGRNNICIGKDFDTFGNNSIILGNNIGINLDDQEGSEYDIGVHESIIIGNNCFSGSTAKNIISIGNNIMRDIEINTSSDFTNISSYFQKNPVLIGNDISYDPVDPAIINIGGCFKEYNDRIEVNKGDKRVVIDQLDISNNNVIKLLLDRIDILEQKIADISK